MVLARVTLLVAAFALAMSQPANAADKLQKVTIAFAGKGMSFIVQYVALGAGYYKDEGLEPDIVDVSSGTRQAAAVMGGSADFTQLGLPHTLRAVARGGDLVAIGSGFDKYPIALVISKTAAQKLGITDAMPPGEKIKRLHGLTIGITSPGSSTDEFMRTIMMVRGMDPDKDVKLQPIGIGAPMVAAMQQGSTDGFAFMSPFTDIAVSRGIGTVIADPMQGNLPEYQDVPYQVITTSRKTVEAGGRSCSPRNAPWPGRCCCVTSIRSRQSVSCVSISRTSRKPTSISRSIPTSKQCRRRRSSAPSR